jgi:RHS repeat-associated protein
MGDVTQFGYDANGNRISQTDALGRTTRYEYNYLDKLIRVIDPAGGATIYNYDANGNLTSITDANGQTTRYVYDVQNRLISETDPLGNTTGYAYDLIGNLTSHTDAEGRTIHYTYDGLNRLLQKSYPDGSIESFTYDANGHILTAGNSSIAYTFRYDADGRVTSVTDSRGKSLGYQYDPAGNRTRLIYPDGKTVIYSYDAANRLSSLTDWANRITAFTYDKLGRRVNLALSNGTQTAYSYDSASRLTNLTHQTRGGTVLDRFTYTYNAIGNRLSVTRPEETLNYTYDLLDRLIKATPMTMRGSDKEHDDRNKEHDYKDSDHDSNRGRGHENDKSKDHEFKGERFTYDAVGNRLIGPESKDTFGYNAGNQLIADRKHQYTFDRNGNLIQKTEIDDDWETDTWTYTYDFENRLIRVVKHEGHETTTVAFKYDPFGRRIEKTVSDREGHRTEMKTTRYLYDNEDIVVDFDGSGHTLARYVQGPGIDEPLMIQKGAEAYYYHADGLGSITELTDSRHKVVESYTYSSFGVLKREGDEVKNRFTFTGREWDDDEDMYYYRARYYDSTMGRFNSVDPKLRAPGSGGSTKSCGAKLPTGSNITVPLELNQYIYTIDNPINNSDSTGLSVTTIVCSASIIPRIQSAPAQENAAAQTCLPCEDR